MKKIILIVAVIATITTILCIGANAYDAGEIIPAGTTIKFKDTITGFPNADYSVLATFTSNGTDYSRIYVNSSNTVQYKAGTNSPVAVYANNRWLNENYKTIKLLEDYTISENAAIFFNNNVDDSISQALNNTKATFATTLTITTAIIAWLMANQIALVGLYLYILIALVATGKRFITGV